MLSLISSCQLQIPCTDSKEINSYQLYIMNIYVNQYIKKMRTSPKLESLKTNFTIPVDKLNNVQAILNDDQNTSPLLELDSPQPQSESTSNKQRSASPLSPSHQIKTNYINCVLEPTAELGGIYISDFDYASNLQNLENNNITSVLSIDRNLNFKLPDSINHKTIIVFDNEMEQIKAHFDKTYSFILNSIQNKQNILIHCRRGISRSATIVIAFLMKFQNKSYEESYNYLKERRPIINPNSGFVKQLKNFEVVLKEYLFYTNQLK